jgi:hypothetical protein
MNIPDHISESLETSFGVKIPVLDFFDADTDPGYGNLFDPVSGMEINSDPGWKLSQIRNTACTV